MMARRLFLAVLLVVVAVSLYAVGQAGAFVYWTEPGGGIGRANLDGTNPTWFFVPQERSREAQVVAVDAQHIYWAGVGGIGRANLDGTNPTESFIPAGYSPDALAMALDAQHIYWVNNVGGIGRANLDGTDATETFIPAPAIYGVAVDAEHVYWSGIAGIGMANLDGTNVTEFFPPNTFADNSFGVAVDAQHIYWSGYTGGIGRANLDGTNATNFLIPSPDALRPQELAVDSQHIYWANGGLGEANLDGTNPTTVLIGLREQTPAEQLHAGVAVDAGASNAPEAKRSPVCVVPSLKRDTLSAAKSALERAHCKLGKVTRPHKHHGRLHVASQHPKKGKRLKAGSPVAVTLR